MTDAAGLLGYPGRLRNSRRQAHRNGKLFINSAGRSRPRAAGCVWLGAPRQRSASSSSCRAYDDQAPPSRQHIKTINLSTTSITLPPTKYRLRYPSASTTWTAGPSIIFTFLPSHQLISPAAMATPHPRAINVPVAHVGLSSRL
jgi:hypothetical protein